MGGNAFKHLNTKRIDKKEFDDSFLDIKNKLNQLKLDVVPAFFEKSTFGDLDVVVEEESMNKWLADNNWEIDKEFYDFLKIKFNSRGIRNAYPVISFEYRKNKNEERGFQVDLIYIPKKFYNFCLNYFSYNDLGNLLGVMYRALGVKFGHYGLNYEIYSKETHYMGDVLITNDFDKALNFLKLDVDRFKKGFNNLEEVFDYVISSPYFNKGLYDLIEGVSSYKARRRNAQRSTYKLFLKWLKEQPEERLPSYQHTKDKDERLSLIVSHFGNEFIDNIKEVRNKEKEKNSLKIKFSGEKVSYWTGLTHQALGELLKQFNLKFKNKEEYDKWLKETDIEEMKKQILNLKNSIDFSGMIGDPKTNPRPLTRKRKK